MSIQISSARFTTQCARTIFMAFEYFPMLTTSSELLSRRYVTDRPSVRFRAIMMTVDKALKAWVIQTKILSELSEKIRR